MFDPIDLLQKVRDGQLIWEVRFSVRSVSSRLSIKLLLSRQRVMMSWCRLKERRRWRDATSEADVKWWARHRNGELLDCANSSRLCLDPYLYVTVSDTWSIGGDRNLKTEVGARWGQGPGHRGPFGFAPSLLPVISDIESVSSSADHGRTCSCHWPGGRQRGALVAAYRHWSSALTALQWSRRNVTRVHSVTARPSSRASHLAKQYEWMNEWIKHLYCVLQPTAGLLYDR